MIDTQDTRNQAGRIRSSEHGVSVKVTQKDIVVNEKEREKVRKELRRLGDKFLQVVREEVDSAVILCDVDRLDGLIDAFRMQLDHELVNTIKKKGFSKELTALCDKVGRGHPPYVNPSQPYTFPDE